MHLVFDKQKTCLPCYNNLQDNWGNIFKYFSGQATDHVHSQVLGHVQSQFLGHVQSQDRDKY